MISLRFKRRKRRLSYSMIARSLKLRSSEIPSTLKLIASMVSKIENTNLRCPWKSEKKKSRFTKIYSYLSQRLQKRRDTKSQ